MSAYTDAMTAAFAVMVAQWGATLTYAEGYDYALYAATSGALYTDSDGNTYAKRTRGASILGIKTPLSLGFQMQVSGYGRKADTAFDALRGDVILAGLYTPCIARNPATVRPSVIVSGESFMVLDVKDDIASDPTVKLILADLQ